VLILGLVSALSLYIIMAFIKGAKAEIARKKAMA
jgi:hypothetical protein